MGAVIKQTSKTNPVMGIPPDMSGSKVSHTVPEGRPSHVSSEGRKEDSRRKSTGQHPSLDRKINWTPSDVAGSFTQGHITQSSRFLSVLIPS